VVDEDDVLPPYSGSFELLEEREENTVFPLARVWDGAGVIGNSDCCCQLGNRFVLSNYA
jgi:hypothetical protein